MEYFKYIVSGVLAILVVSFMAVFTAMVLSTLLTCLLYLAGMKDGFIIDNSMVFFAFFNFVLMGWFYVPKIGKALRNFLG